MRTRRALVVGISALAGGFSILGAFGAPAAGEPIAPASAAASPLFSATARIAASAQRRSTVDVTTQGCGTLRAEPCESCSDSTVECRLGEQRIGASPRIGRAEDDPSRSALVFSVTANCTALEGCSGGPDCTAGGGCSMGTYCTAGGDCTIGPMCSAGPDCTSGPHCTEGLHCSSGPQCTTSPYCTSGEACTASPICSDRCTATGPPDCDPGQMTAAPPCLPHRFPERAKRVAAVALHLPHEPPSLVVTPRSGSLATALALIGLLVVGVAGFRPRARSRT
jgi:hypothetical protein